MSNGYLTAVETLERLADDTKMACLGALHKAETGQAKLAEGRYREALTLLLAAHTVFEAIPEARKLLGINKQDIAATYANMGNLSVAEEYARAAVAIVGGDSSFGITEAMAEMTLGAVAYSEGQVDSGAAHFSAARGILLGTPDAQHHLELLERNEAALKATSAKVGRGSSGCLTAVMGVLGIVAASGYCLVRLFGA